MRSGDATYIRVLSFKDWNFEIQVIGHARYFLIIPLPETQL